MSAAPAAPGGHDAAITTPAEGGAGAPGSRGLNGAGGIAPGQPRRPRAALFVLTILAATGISHTRAAAQRPSGYVAGPVWFPRRPLFPSPLAAPHAPRFAGAFVITDILRPSVGLHPAERPPFPINEPAPWEVMAIVNLGGSYPVYRVPWGKGAFEVGGQVGMDTRFRMKLPRKDMFSADWMVSGAVSAAQGPWSWRARAIHRSSHMGDQFLQATGAHRIQLGNDGFDLFGARYFGPVRIYAGGEWIAHSEADPEVLAPGESDVWQAQAGFDADWHAWPRRPWWSVVGGFDWQSAQRTGWKPSFAAEAGIRFTRGARSARLVLRAFDGESEVYQFFRTREAFYGLELVVVP